jgi:hypothetical protein
MKTIFLLFIILVPFWGNAQEYYRTEKYCDKYSEWFAKDSVKWNKEDSIVAIEYSKKLYVLYKPIKEFYFSGEQPDQEIYSALHYDTTLLFSTLKLYAESREEYDRQIGIPIGQATRLINRDATIIGTVVDKINKYKELRWYTTTYFVRTDSVIFSYFPINIGDTLLVQSLHFGGSGIPVDIDMQDYQVGNSSLCFSLNRNVYVRHFHSTKPPHLVYLDPFCTNSFTQYIGENPQNCLNDTDPKGIHDFVKRIKKWY